MRPIVEARAPGSEEPASRTALAPLVDEEGVELAVSSGLFEPATHAFGFGLCQSNAWSFDLPLLDSGTGVIARSGPGAAHALARHAVPQAAIRHALKQRRARFQHATGSHLGAAGRNAFRLANAPAFVCCNTLLGSAESQLVDKRTSHLKNRGVGA